MNPDEITREVMTYLRNEQVTLGGYVMTTHLQKVVESIVTGLCAAFEARMSPYINALQLVGNMVDVHNQALRGMSVPEPLTPEKSMFWDCYCGTRNAGGRTCLVCSRSA